MLGWELAGVVFLVYVFWVGIWGCSGIIRLFGVSFLVGLIVEDGVREIS